MSKNKNPKVVVNGEIRINRTSLGMYTIRIKTKYYVRMIEMDAETFAQSITGMVCNCKIESQKLGAGDE